MNAKLLITGKIGNITEKVFQGNDGQSKTLLNMSVCYRSVTSKDAQGQDVKSFEYASFLIGKNTFTQTLQKGDTITVVGEPKVNVYLKKDASVPTPVGVLQLERVEVTLAAKGTGTSQQASQGVPQTNGYGVPQGQATPQSQGYVPQGTPQGYAPQGMPQGYVPQGVPQGQGVQQAAPQPQGYVPQGAPQGYAPQGMPQGYTPQGYAPQAPAPQGGYTPQQFNVDVSDDDLPF